MLKYFPIIFLLKNVSSTFMKIPESTNSAPFKFISNVFKSSESFNKNLFSTISAKRQTDIESLSRIAWLFDIRIIITLVGIVAVALYFFQFENENLKKIRINIRSFLLVLFVAKYTFTIVALILFPAHFYTFSNLLFGRSVILFASYVIDIIVFFAIKEIMKREKYVVIGEFESITKSVFDRVNYIIKTIGSKKLIVCCVFGVIFFIFGIFGVKAELIGNLFKKITPQILIKFSDKYFYPIYQIIAVTHYPFTNIINEFVMKYVEIFVQKDYLIVSYLVKKASFLINMAVSMGVTYVAMYAFKYVLDFFNYLISLFFKVKSINIKEFDVHDNNYPTKPFDFEDL